MTNKTLSKCPETYILWVLLISQDLDHHVIYENSMWGGRYVCGWVGV